MITKNKVTDKIYKKTYILYDLIQTDYAILNFSMSNKERLRSNSIIQNNNKSSVKEEIYTEQYDTKIKLTSHTVALEEF